MVYVQNIKGKPLMPCKEAKARKLLKNKRAKIIKRTPFTIQLLFECEDQVQPLNLGVDAGSTTIGLSVCSESKEYFASEVVLRTDITKLLATRRQNRVTRRKHLRHRQPRFLNRVKSKHKGWLAPSIKHKINTHLKVIDNIRELLPISKVIIETASFDVQKLKNPKIQKKEYQAGPKSNFSNIRQYVLHRDNHICCYCKGKSKDSILQVHHIESRKTGGDSPNNLVTLCKTCHNNYHKGKIDLKIKRGTSFKDASHMNTMRKTLLRCLKNQCSDIPVEETFGYITKNNRITHNLPKTHAIDARCISGYPLVEALGYVYIQRKVRCHNRQLHKTTFKKGGKRQRNQAPYFVKGYSLFDKVSYLGKICFITGRRQSGSFMLKDINYKKVTDGITYKKLKLLDRRKYYMVDKVAI